MMHTKILAGLSTLGESAQLLGLDWMSRRRRVYWDQARWALRTLRFRAHAAIPSIPLGDLCRELGHAEESVTLPSATTDLGGVGSADYYFALGATARALAPKTIVEFGTYRGVGTLVLASNAPTARVHTIDLPEDTGPRESLNDSDRALVTTNRQRVGEAFLGSPVADRIVQIRADSKALRLSDLVPRADLVVVDGGHSTELIAADTENALAVIDNRGVILWDDYWWFHPEVVHYLDRRARELKLRRIEGTNLVAYSRRPVAE
jgi:hypothetical protein